MVSGPGATAKCHPLPLGMPPGETRIIPGRTTNSLSYYSRWATARLPPPSSNGHVVWKNSTSYWPRFRRVQIIPNCCPGWPAGWDRWRCWEAWGWCQVILQQNPADPFAQRRESRRYAELLRGTPLLRTRPEENPAELADLSGYPLELPRRPPPAARKRPEPPRRVRQIRRPARLRRD